MLHELSFLSFNQRDQIQAWIYVPSTKPIGIIQIIHGFCEHSRRYLHMIVSFNDAGFIVAADDHVGHGRTAALTNKWGDWGDKGPKTMVEDEHTLTNIVKEKFPNLPYFIFGHSMGSFIARDYIANYGNEIDCVALCGTAGVFPNLEEGKKLCQQHIDEGKGEESDPNVAQILLGWMFQRCTEEIKYGNEWSCSDPIVIYNAAHDPFCSITRPTTNRSYLYFCQMIETITGPSWAEKVPKNLPIYNVAGSEDPVGLYGEGVKQVTKWLEDSGHKVSMKIYPGYRHEIHQYNDLKNTMEQQLIEFFRNSIKN